MTMKSHFILWCCMFFLACSAHATVFTVSADVNQPAQFTSLQNAHDSAINGDTIIWYGNTSPGSVNVTKRLNICGLENTLDYAPSISFGADSEGSVVLSGYYSDISFGYPSNSELYLIANSKVNNLSGSANLQVINSIIWQLSLASTDYITQGFYNCIFSSIYSEIETYVYNSNSSFIFDHCVFEDGLRMNTNGIPLPLPQVVFSNCIFTSINSSSCFPVNTAFDHSMFVGFTFDNTQFCGPLIGANCIMNAPDPFVNGNTSNWETADFQLNAASAGNNAASDGTDMGVHGGSYTWPINYHYGLNPPGVPVVNSLNLENYVIGISDQIQINAQGSIPSND